MAKRAKPASRRRDVTRSKHTADHALAAEQRTSRQLGDKVDLSVAQLRRLAAQLTVAEEREREAIARDLHDNLAQLLHVIRLKLAALARAPAGEDAAARLRELDELTRQAEGGARSLVFKLVPPVLAELGLVPALHWLAEEMQRTHGLAVEVREDGAAKPLTQEVRTVLYRAVRELLINIAKHAGTGRALVEVSADAARLRVAVRDEGRGFDAGKALAAPTRGLGLVSVRERLQFAGGSAEFRGAPGKGAETLLTVPIEGGARA